MTNCYVYYSKLLEILQNSIRSSRSLLVSSNVSAPVWSRSAHTSRVDVQLNSTMRLISGTLRSTPLPWLPVLSSIEPPALRRKAASLPLTSWWRKSSNMTVGQSSHQPDILSPPLLRLTSRKPSGSHTILAKVAFSYNTVSQYSDRHFLTEVSNGKGVVTRATDKCCR